MKKTRKSVLLHFMKPTEREDREIRRRYAEMKNGKSVVMRPIK
jgi:hypothetical protein